ncbi:MAG: DUF3662 and FHA domain-containing protein [Acidimicrobiia bacterium]
MGLARGLERRLERMVDGLAARLFKGRVHPVELGSRLVREADLAQFDTPGGPGAPNAFRVTMGGEDEVEPEVLTAVRAELAQFVEDAAADRGWRLDGLARVDVEIDPDARPSEVGIECWVEPGPRPPWARLEPIAGGPWIPIGVNRAVVGRSSGADIHVPRDDVSRIHALIWQESGSAWLADLGSSNGSHVNGKRVLESTPIVDGDIVSFGGAEYFVRPPE